METSYFDLVVATIILLLGLKGILNGFFKELFGLVGIIGGIFVASRVGDMTGEYLNSLIFNFTSPAAVSFLGFLVTLALFWLLMVGAGAVFKKLSALSGLGALDKLLGFVFGSGKFFLIAAVIMHAAYSIAAVRANIDSTMQKSILFPILVETGAFIMKIDPVEIGEDINATIEKGTNAISETKDQILQESIKEQMQTIKDQIEKKQIEEK